MLVWFSPLRIDMNVANLNQIQFGMVGVLAAILSGPGDRSLRRQEWLSPDRIEQTESHRRSDGTTVRQFLAGAGWECVWRSNRVCCGAG